MQGDARGYAVGGILNNLSIALTWNEMLLPPVIVFAFASVNAT